MSLFSRFASGLLGLSAATVLLLGPLLLGPMATSASAQERKNLLLDAKSWGYQLRNLGTEQQKKIAASPYDVVIIDYEQDAVKTETPLTKAEVEAMKKKPDGSRRLVMAYFSIGEAETYRGYWKPEWTKNKPSWVGKENKEWKDNFLVKYWEPAWQQIVFGSPTAFADKVLAAGFDGFYLDRVDAYYYFGDTTEKRTQMVDFVSKLTTYIRSKKPDAMILGQNAEELLDRPEYIKAIDGIAKESLYYGIPGADKANPADDISHSGKLLNKARAAGKAVYCVEYLKNPANIESAKKRMEEKGFVLYVANRGLAELNPSPTAVPPPTGESVIQKVVAKVLPNKPKNR
jgi:cysteinyl-tRNA synthetase, unknown class